MGRPSGRAARRAGSSGRWVIQQRRDRSHSLPPPQSDAFTNTHASSELCSLRSEFSRTGSVQELLDKSNKNVSGHTTQPKPTETPAIHLLEYLHPRGGNQNVILFLCTAFGSCQNFLIPNTCVCVCVCVHTDVHSAHTHYQGRCV